MAVELAAANEAFRPHIWPDTAPELQALERLEAEITELWGHLNAATYRFLKLLAEFDRRKGFELHGLVRCSQWLNWQCGIGEGAAREKVRVARALEALPKTSDAFARGVISYSKVRAMTRIATPANEADLLNVALHGTAAHVERLVGKYRRVERLEDAARAEGLHRERSLKYWYDEDGSLVIHAKLPPEIGAVVAKAIEGAVSALDEKGVAAAETESNVSAETSEADPEPTRDTFGAKRADALRLIVEAFLARQSDDHGSVADRFQVVVHVDQRTLAGAEPAPDVGASFTRDPRCEVENGRALAVETVRRLACDASVVGIVEGDGGEPLNVGRKMRTIPPALKRALSSRDGGCRFPGCTHSRFTEGHHIVHWAGGGETKLGNLVTLCRFHHRLIHEGGFGLHVLDDGAERDKLVFTRPDGTRVEPNGRKCFRGNNVSFDPCSPSQDTGRSFAGPALLAANRDLGLAIDWQTSRCHWAGEVMDYGIAVEALLHSRATSAKGFEAQLTHDMKRDSAV